MNKPAFSKAEVPDAVAVVGQQFKVDMQMRVGATQTAVEVTESAPLIDTTGVTRSNNISAEEFCKPYQVEKLPMFSCACAFSQ